ncbi:MAG: NAD(P)H-binding protein [Alcanivorax sp.]|uniref:NAD(P)H-binding protein n=1 Tax=Alloalcanivorax marinus TaxID=1177169 RepID=A0A9Q3UKR2_9GAMM|nr:NAD(P)H-binding protein [Alloalcanivorax marinus]MBM7333904.1 NAD(P)H-binding protein [Alloalcanivorax marinus]MCC4309036.1 NAD(P)H-binding protein [Alloalcanivorax marinus]
MSRRALLLGATGLVGGHCLRKLLECDDYEEVRVLTRRAVGLDHPKLVERVIDPADIEQHGDFFAVDDVFCALGTTLKQAGSKEAFRRIDLDLVMRIGRLARDAGVQRFLLVSAVNANAHSPFFYARIKGQLERELKALKLPLLALFQPSLLLGERETPRPVEAFGIRFSKIVDPITRWTDAHWLPVSGERVAEALLGMALMGPDTGTYRVRFRDFVVYAGKYRDKYLRSAS